MSDHRTIYEHNGYKLRSYTELMWARLMDAVDLFYLYEPDLIQVEGCKYLPDFYLPAADLYLEVKGKYPTEEEKRKAADVLRVTGRPVVFLVSRPESDKNGFMNCCLMAQRGDEWGFISLHDLDRLYRIAAGEVAWVKALLSVREEPLDWLRPVSEVAEELLLDMMGRSAMEDHLRLTHKRVNEQRKACVREQSLAEKGVSWWRQRYFSRTERAKQQGRVA